MCRVASCRRHNSETLFAQHLHLVDIGSLVSVSVCQPDHQDCLYQVVHERLGELLRVLKAVINKHQTLNSVDILSAAGTVIAQVKGVNFKDVNEENKQKLFGEIYTSIDTLAFTFGNIVSDFLMGDVDNGSPLVLNPLTPRSRVAMLSVRPRSNDFFFPNPWLVTVTIAGPSLPARAEEVDGVDVALQRSEGGVESALLYTKAWSMYTKELLAWVDKRISMDIECARSYAKMAESAKTIASHQEFMPFRDIYMSAFKNDIEYSQLLLHTAAALQTNKFMQPLLARKTELDKLRKEVKEQWQREQKKMHETDSALRKAHVLQAQRQEEYEKARVSTSRVEEEQLGSAKLEKRRRLEEEALQKADEARDHCKACLTDVGVKRVDLANTKSEILTQLRKLVFQCDLTLKAMTVNWFQLQQAQVVSLPVNHQSLCESSKLYEPGQQYIDFVRSLPAHLDRPRVQSYSFDVTVSHCNNAGFPLAKRSLSSTRCSTHSSHGNLSQMSATSGDFLGTDEVDSPFHTRPTNSSTDIQALRFQGPFRAWGTGSQGREMCSDSESTGGSSESRSMDSPTASPGDFNRRLRRSPSTGTMSSADDLDEREPPSLSDNGLDEMVTETASSPGPFHDIQMSKAAQTHKLRKLRALSKCRECDSLVVFYGAECEECFLACHKKCLETLAIQCGHKKLHGRLHLFGVDFTQAVRNNPDGIPFIIRKCTSEIENRALDMKGIYRVNGAKSRVEKLCQVFENGKDLVELSDLYPHDISNVLKLYLRQLPEPLILFRFYNDFIGLAKESRNIIVDELEASRVSPASMTPPQVSVELNRVLFKIKDLLRQLPPAHYKTLHFLIQHLHRVTEQAEENKMTASNLGIIFGPTLIKPRQTDAEVSLSALVDYPYQALIVELLIRHYQMIFDAPVSPLPRPQGPPGPSEESFSLEDQDPYPRFTTQEKQLSRQPLVDIKESCKVFKCHSSIVPSTHVQRAGGERGERRLIQALHTTSRVHLPRAKLVSRPVSMPAEHLNPAQGVDERNGRNTSIEEVSEDEKPKSRVTSHYRNMDTGTLRRTWDRQYKPYDVTPRTAKINLPTADKEEDSTRSLSTSNVWEYSQVPTVFRPPRTLQPPPGTFYKPPTGSMANALGDTGLKKHATVANSTEEEEDDEEDEMGLEVSVDEDTVDEYSEAPQQAAGPSLSLSLPQSPGSSPEDLSQEGKPVYQRLRPRRLQELEHREAHYV
uniref:Rho GTPase-activating protein 29 n=1 Tax=Salmo trutta TaxID=8032 RepID=A0A673ZIG5_SALTR